jgi:heterodisulfide reductase subunit A-like polyferredoxin
MTQTDISLPAGQHSYWLDEALALNLPELAGEMSCDAVIIGGGIAGLTAAYKLKEAGLNVLCRQKK